MSKGTSVGDVRFIRKGSRIIPIHSPSKGERNANTIAKSALAGAGATLATTGAYFMHAERHLNKLKPSLQKAYSAKAIGRLSALGNVGTGLLVAGSVAAIVRNQRKELRMRAAHMSDLQKTGEHLKANAKDYAFLGAAGAGTYAALTKGGHSLRAGAKVAKSASKTAQATGDGIRTAWRAFNKGRTVVMKPRYGGAAKTVFSTVKGISGKIGY